MSSAIDKSRTLQDLLALREGWESKRYEAELAIRALDLTIKLLRPPSDDVVDYKPARQSHTQIITDAIEKILMTERPMHRARILEILERDFHIGGSDPLTTLSALLSRDRRFKNTRRGFWSLSIEPDSSQKPHQLATREMDFDQGGHNTTA